MSQHESKAGTLNSSITIGYPPNLEEIRKLISENCKLRSGHVIY